MRMTRTRRGGRLAPAALAMLLAGAAPAPASYAISPGDTLEIDALSIPELKVRTVVDDAGEVAVPLVGQIRVGGLSLADARARIQQQLPTKEFRRRTVDGREYPVILSPSEINVTVAEYRPVYLNGDVAKPGAQTYRPGLTVRQSIALAGGFDVLRFKMDNPFLQLADLRETYDRAWIAYAQEQQRLNRLDAELAGQKEIDRRGLIDTPLPPSFTKDLTESETQILKARLADFVKQKAFLNDARGKEGERARVLSEQEKREKDGVQADTEELKNYQELYGRGTVPITRMSDARRNLLLSSTRALQTTALLGSVEREKGNLDRKLEQTTDQRHLDLLRERQESVVALSAIRSRLQAVGDKLRYAGMVRSQLVRGFDSDPIITVVRLAPGGAQRIRAGYDATLQPGDVVEVALRAGEPPEAAPADPPKPRTALEGRDR